MKNNFDNLFEVVGPKFDILLMNPPYERQKYAKIIDYVIRQTNPTDIGMVTPQNMLKRPKITSEYNFKYVNFLNSDAWMTPIQINTISSVLSKNYSGPIHYIGRWLKQSYYSNNLDINGETQALYDLITNIQTEDKFKLYSHSKPIGPGNQVKITRKNDDMIIIEDGFEWDSHNDEWRTIFGFLKSSAVGIIEPGLSIPNKYYYAIVGSGHEAKIFQKYFLTKFIRYILFVTKTSKSISTPELSWVPKIDFNLFDDMNDEIIYNHFNVDKDLQKIIHQIIGEEIPF